MATNADEAVDDSKQVTAQDLHDLKYGVTGVETSQEADETDETEETGEEEQTTGEETETNSDDQATDESEESEEQDSSDDESGYVKEFPNIKGETLEEYARNLERAYQNSTTEALRLKGIAEGKISEKESKKEVAVDTSDPVALFMKQKMDEEISTAFADFQKSYPQAVPGTPEYAQFVSEVSVLSKAILDSQKRLAPPKELYTKAAVILGWEPSGKIDNKEKLGIALKDGASISKTSSAIKTPKKSKVTPQMIAVNKLMYPNKTEAEIIEELEPHVK